MINPLISRIFRVVFHALARCRPATPAELSGREFRTILVFSAAGIGDTLTDSVAIRALKESHPKARVVVVTHRRRAALAMHNPFADEVRLYHKSLFRFFTLVRELRAVRPDVIVMLRGNDPDLWPMAYLVNRHAVVSCPVMTRFRFLISHPVEIPAWDATHGVEQTLEIVRRVGADTSDRRLVYVVRDEEREALRPKLRDLGVTDKPMVVFQVGGGRRSAWRDWPVGHYVKLGEKLLAACDVQLVLLGGPDLCDKAGEIAARLPPEVRNLVGRLSLPEAAALLSLAKILVSTDTGIMHLGFAVGVDTLALIHCNNPASRVGPYGYGDKNPVAQLEPPPGVKADKNVAMALLTPEIVWPLLEKLASRHGLVRASMM